jgi:hypothetical protein
MNPLRWKPEHLMALIVATLVGAAAGVGFGYSNNGVEGDLLFRDS